MTFALNVAIIFVLLMIAWSISSLYRMPSLFDALSLLGQLTARHLLLGLGILLFSSFFLSIPVEFLTRQPVLFPKKAEGILFTDTKGLPFLTPSTQYVFVASNASGNTADVVSASLKKYATTNKFDIMLYDDTQYYVPWIVSYDRRPVYTKKSIQDNFRIYQQDRKEQ